MGNTLAACCNSDLFSELRQKYGETFTKLMIAEKAKEFISAHFGSINTTFKDIFHKFKQNIQSLISSKK